MKRLLSIVMSIAVLLIGVSPALAAQEIIEADGSYVMDSRLDEIDSPENANRVGVDKILAANQSAHFLNNCMVVFVR